jgi:hypothetical protein
MSPLFIKMLLHFCATPAPWTDMSPAAVDCFSAMLRDGLVKDLRGAPGGMAGQTTDRGKALVQMLCATPFPEQRWFDPRTKEAIET